MKFDISYNGYPINESIFWDKSEEATQGYTTSFIIHLTERSFRIKYTEFKTIEETMKYIDSIVESKSINEF